MTQRDAADQGFRGEEGDERKPKRVWGHPRAAAAICLGAGAALALIALLG